MNGGAGAGDWQCPNPTCMNHSKMVFGRHSSCPKCGAPRGVGYSRSVPRNGGGYGGHGGGYVPAVPQPRMAVHQPRIYASSAPPAPKRTRLNEGEVRPDDWQCSNEGCINHTKLVFGRHDACPSCGTSKTAKAAGDWQCPNANCQNHRSNVFASKVSCPKCGAPRPTRGGARMSYQAPAYIMPQPAPVPVYVMSPVLMPGSKNGVKDWKCPNTECINNTRLVFGKNDSCPKCGTENPKPPDWKCPNTDCQNHTRMVFGTKQSCPLCGEEKNGSRARSRSR